MHSKPETLWLRLASWMGEGSLTVSPALSLAWSAAQGRKQIISDIKIRSTVKTLHVGLIVPFSLGPPFADFVNQRTVLLGWL